ncbi:MAG TPA: hypothetical protein EYM39_00225 [Candidatus Latescibacteria bacterium]|nr:hypothetical protein [Candidatus Latescibacterota bacterium]HIM55106.1 hypothetical protein [Candidatus Latescibacterota bacterium]
MWCRTAAADGGTACLCARLSRRGTSNPRRYEFAEEWATGLRPEHMLDWLYSDLHRRRDVLAKAR